MVCPARWDNLLVCTDGSEEGQHAVTATLELARVCGSKVYVVQVLQLLVPEAQVWDPNFTASQVAHVRNHMEAVKDAAARLGVPIHPVVPRSEVPHTAIVEEVEKIRPDLVIMGRGGKTTLGRLWLGSVSAQVIGHSPVHVMVVPRDAAVSFQRLLVASDGSPQSEAAWKLALAMAKQAGSRLISVAVAPKKGDLPEAKATLQKMLIAAGEAGMPLKMVKGLSPQGVAPDVGIVQEARQNEVDMIIMGSHGRTSLKEFLIGSTTERVIGQAPCPVLVAKS
jgi:uncharacterized protein